MSKLDKHLPALLSLAGDAYVDIPENFDINLRMPQPTVPDPKLILTALLSLVLPLPEGHTIESFTELLKQRLITAGIDKDHVEKMFALSPEEKTWIELN